jgi:aryl carrier-like protein
MYRTGDLGRWLADGNIEFLGRNDFQVKVRGFRIELGEIEARLAEHPEVREAVVIAREEAAGDQRLVAYYTSALDSGPGAEQLRAHMLAVLPEYMVPAAYVRLEKLPLTGNGKLDRKALPAPEADAYGAGGYEAPEGETEAKLAQIWAEVLKIERIGRHDNFFSLGGHSLLAVTMIERLRRIGLRLDVRAIFATPTLAGMAATAETIPSIQVPANRIPPGCQTITPEMLPLVQLTAEEIERIVEKVPGGAGNVQDIYPLAPLQEGILFHHLMGGEGDPYLLAIQLGFDNHAQLESYIRALQTVIDRHDILRTAVQWEGLSEPVQVVYRKARLPVEEVELETASGAAAEQLYARYDPRRFRMDVRQAPLLRLHIAYDPAGDRWLAMMLLHHLAVDHTTFEAMQSEVQAHLLGQEATLPTPLPFRNLVAQARMELNQEEEEYETA